MEMERRSHEIERRAGERVAAECEAVLQRVLRQVGRRVVVEEQAAARAASIQAKQRRRDEIEVRSARLVRSQIVRLQGSTRGLGHGSLVRSQDSMIAR